MKSALFAQYLRCKTLERKEVTVDSFHTMRMLGRGAFGSVFACKKKDTGRLYAMKQLDKRRVQATDSVHALLAERDFLAQMDSRFVTSLKYCFADAETLFLIMDLMTGGDLKFHTNRDGTFAEPRIRFIAAQMLLGLEHIHANDIVFRDLKLENVLVDDRGHVKLSDLGLAVSVEYGPVKGYAGTPGYTAPEVVLSHEYERGVDFFSLGVVIYRALSGKKPFAKRRSSKQQRLRDVKGQSAELDQNVVAMMPRFVPRRCFNGVTRSLLRGLLMKNVEWRLGSDYGQTHGVDEVKAHPWFDCIDWALLEAGRVESPHAIGKKDINAERQQNIGRPSDDAKYAKVKINEEFERSLDGFAFRSPKVIQSELVEVLEKLQQQRRDSKRVVGADAEQLYAFPTPQEYKQSLQHECCVKCLECTTL